MKIKILIFCFSIFLFSPYHAHAKFPIHLGGFELGDNISKYHHLIDMKTCREDTFNKYIGEGKTLQRPGFKSGVIAYGLCDAPDKILRIKLKFADASKSFFKKLLRRYEKELGPPSEYRGDPFQTIIAWKWSFVNNKKEKISLTLQHNSMVEDEKLGNAVKLTLTSQIEKERVCFMTKSPGRNIIEPLPRLKGKALWDLYIPY
ncbi:MAG: hypothetical protein K8S13_14020 [Desulfobacula sp.]|uniref:hypothetical protein n=1 Tax=Desulfobacula sp. TaxID=2593537 RepID=UPI0025C64E40|nr:hypothetical protein [Desulfobacula sp.]MCD4720955.1 hypothetical protein [Desulfobacula sp.]